MAQPLQPQPGPVSDMNAQSASTPSFVGLPGMPPPGALAEDGVPASAVAAEHDVPPAPPMMPASTAAFVSETDFERELDREEWNATYGVPIMLTLICGAVAIALSAYYGSTQAGAEFGAQTGAILGALGYLVLAGFAIPLGVFAAWLVGKMFGNDMGGFTSIVIRTLAVYTTCDALAGTMDLVMPPLLRVLIMFPIGLMIAAKLYGIGMLEAFVLAVVRGALAFLLGMLLLSFFLGILMAGSM
jgi:hypothetical protein